MICELCGERIWQSQKTLSVVFGEGFVLVHHDCAAAVVSEELGRRARADARSGRT